MKKAVLFIVLFIIINSCSDSKETHNSVSQKRPIIKGVKVEKVAKSPVDEYYETSGTIMAKNTASISCKVMGSVKKIFFEEGDRVKEGQLLIKIDDSEFTKKLKQASSAYEEAISGVEMAKENKKLATATFNRFKNLFAEKAITRQEYDEILTKKNIAALALKQAKAGRERAKAAKKEVGIYMEYTKITAPFDAIVNKKFIDVGSMASPGRPLLEVEKPGEYYVRVNLDEKMFKKVYKGLEVKIAIEALDLETSGRITEVIPKVDPVSRTFTVKIDLNESDLQSGFYALVSVPLKKENVLLVPEKAVIERGQQKWVYVVNNNGLVTNNNIKTGKKYDTYVEVLAGLKEGESIIVEGIMNAIDGGILEGAKVKGVK